MSAVDFKRLALVFFKPSTVMRDVAREKPLPAAVLIYVALPVLFFAVEKIIFAEEPSLWGLFANHPSNMAVWMELSYYALPLFIIGALLVFLITRLFKTQGSFISHFCTYAYSLAPVYLIIPLIFLANNLQLAWPIDFIFYVIVIWHLTLVVIAVREGLSVTLLNSIIILLLFLLLVFLLSIIYGYIYFVYFYEPIQYPGLGDISHARG